MLPELLAVWEAWLAAGRLEERDERFVIRGWSATLPLARN